MSIHVQVAQRGVITLPKSLRDTYHIKTGDILSVIDLGEGKFLLSCTPSRVDELLDSLRTSLEAEGENLEKMLTRLRAKRENRRVEPPIP
ncbi:MAG: AbrB/MazE/SpoVT family DNA-binding domain-containing protein [Caldilineaceae bacterium]|nr:AbrB/MazE/SpoVT family DNA-binding domain-containing protein [Caldilineaceae bacterium]